jgi:hypothetical protein
MPFRLYLKLQFLLLFIFLELFYCFSWAQAEPEQSNATTAETRNNSSPQLQKLPNRGAPVGRRRGGTSRNNCPALDLPLTALVPGKETLAGLSKSNSFLAPTVSEHPTFWLYIPKLLDNVRTGEFILQTEAGKDLERTQIKLPSTSGMIGITLSSNSKYSLAIGKKYHWYFKIYCGEPTPERDYFFVDAWVERVAIASELKIQLQITNKADYLVYRDRHIWYDTLTSLGKQLQTNPNNSELQTDWIELLESVELSHLSSQPIVKIYQLQ